MTIHRRALHRISRRDFLSTLGAAGVAAVAGLVPAAGQVPGGRVIDTVDFAGSRRDVAAPLETPLGGGAGARLFTNLARLDPGALTTPNERFFVRTALVPDLPVDGHTVQLAGMVRTPARMAPAEWDRLVQACGEQLVECAGNNNPRNFGLISSAQWEGVPVGALLDRVGPRASTRVLITGRGASATDPPVSWIFSRDDLERSGAFLATVMNGRPLPRDHGTPIRLVVPGWYGCASIKWVTRIELVPDDVVATPHMQIYAARTHQEGVPERARDFAPAVVDHAAMPVRVERWLVDGRLVHRVVGIMWGGTKPTNALQIRFRHDEPFVRVSDCPLPASTATWSLWSHLWRPPAPGRYAIALKVADPDIRTRRLDIYFYTREIVIDEV